MFDIPQEVITRIYRMFSLTPVIFDQNYEYTIQKHDTTRYSSYVWIAEIKPSFDEPKFYLSGARLYDETNSTNTVEFALLIPTQWRIEDDYEFGPIVMDNDPGYEALGKTPFLISHSSFVSDDRPRINVYVMSKMCWTRMFYMGIGEVKDISLLWQSFFEIINGLQVKNNRVKIFFDKYGQHTRKLKSNTKNNFDIPDDTI